MKDDKLLEAYYGLVGEAHLQNLCDEFDEFCKTTEIKVTTSNMDKRFEDYNRKLKKKKKRSELIRRWKNISRKIAVVIGVLLILSVTLTFSVDAIRVRVLNLFEEVKDKYTEFRLEEEDMDNTSLPVESNNYMIFYPTFLPKGYYLEETQGEKVIINSFYTNGEDSIIFVQQEEGVVSQVDTEDATVEEIMIGHVSGYIIREEDSVILIWNNDYFSFLLQGEIGQEEMLKIATSLEKK